MTKIDSRRYYSEYHGHPVRDLKRLLPELRSQSSRLIWTAGDSTLDNKYWFSASSSAVGPYVDVLQPPVMKQDVNYWLNYLLLQQKRQPETLAINTAVEATTLNERTFHLRAQDQFLRDNISSSDILIVSVGGNDVALCPLPCTIAAIAGLVCCVPEPCIEHGCSCGTVPADDCCYGCGPSLCSCACAFPPCLGYLRHLFGTRLQKYIESLTAKTKPAKILVCMVYYPDETNDPGWAGPALGALGYDRNPAKLQALMRKVYQQAVSRVSIDGCEVIPVPLFHVLDGKDTRDYVQRVEPSPSGGRRMAELLLDIIHAPSGTQPLSPAPTASYIENRS